MHLIYFVQSSFRSGDHERLGSEEGASYEIGLITPDTRVNRRMPRLLDQPVFTASVSQTDISGPVMSVASIVNGEFPSVDVVDQFLEGLGGPYFEDQVQL